MLANLAKFTLKSRASATVAFRGMPAKSSILMLSQPRRFYYPDNVLMKREEGEYFADPLAIAERVVRLVGLHDAVKDPAAVTIKSTFDEIGLNPLD